MTMLGFCWLHFQFICYQGDRMLPYSSHYYLSLKSIQILQIQYAALGWELFIHSDWLQRYWQWLVHLSDLFLHLSESTCLLASLPTRFQWTGVWYSLAIHCKVENIYTLDKKDTSNKHQNHEVFSKPKEIFVDMFEMLGQAHIIPNLFINLLCFIQAFVGNHVHVTQSDVN